MVLRQLSPSVLYNALLCEIQCVCYIHMHYVNLQGLHFGFINLSINLAVINFHLNVHKEGLWNEIVGYLSA